MDTSAHALDLLAVDRYMVLATADESGGPWATPVWFAPDGLDRILWLDQRAPVAPGAAQTGMTSTERTG